MRSRARCAARTRPHADRPRRLGKTRGSRSRPRTLLAEESRGRRLLRVALDAIRDPALLLPAIAEAVAVMRAATGRSRRARRARWSGRQALLRDRQLRAAGPPRLRRLCSEVLEAAPACRSSSRAARRCGSPASRSTRSTRSTSSDAVALFVERAQGADPRFLPDRRERGRGRGDSAGASTACRSPSSFAAARTKLLPPDAMLAHARRAPRTCSAAAPATSPSGTVRSADTVAWSYDLLGPDEKTPLRPAGRRSAAASRLESCRRCV